VSDAAIPLEEIIKNGVRKRPDVSALASLADHQIALMVWHYHDDDLAGPEAAVSLTIPGLPPECRSAHVTHYRIDESHSNAYTLWQALGSPQKPSAAQYTDLENAGKLAILSPPPLSNIANHTATLRFSLPRQGVSLLILKWD
jgi:xylan 1,4-beta-xylosidase